MIAAIFKDKEIQARFERDGYVVFDFISPQQAAQIAEKFYELHDEIPEGFYSTAESPDDNFKKAISDHAEQVIAHSMERVFQDYRKLGITFLCKAPGAEGKVPVHRDWMVVDETKYFSGTIWVPTSDVSEANGALKVWPGSHKFFKQLRSSSIPVAYEGYEQEIWDQMVTVPMKAGQAFLLNHAVIHASSANLTDKERLILVCGVIPAGAGLNYYHGTDKGTVEKFDMPDDMFMKHSEIGGRPRVGVKVDEFEYKVVPENRLKIQQLLTSSKLERIAKPLFADEELQRSFAEKGFFKTPVLSEVEVDSLKDLLREHPEEMPSAEFVERVKQLMHSKITFKDEPVRVIDVTVEVQRKGPVELEHIHQELSCVENEEEYGSVTCRIPLTDAGVNAGAPGFITGSHLFLGNKRPSPQPQGSYQFNGSEFDVFPYLQTVELKAGEAVLFDDRIFHGGLTNGGEKDVVFISVKLVHPKARLCHYFLNPNKEAGSMLKYVVDERFFQKYDNMKLSALFEKGQSIPGYDPEEIVGFKYPEFTTGDLVDLLKAEGSLVNQTLVKQLERLPAYQSFLFEKETAKEAIVKKTEVVNVDMPAPSAEIHSHEERDFWQTYSPLNIVREIKKRVLG